MLYYLASQRFGWQPHPTPKHRAKSTSLVLRLSRSILTDIQFWLGSEMPLKEPVWSLVPNALGITQRWVCVLMACWQVVELQTVEPNWMKQVPEDEVLFLVLSLLVLCSLHHELSSFSPPCIPCHGVLSQQKCRHQPWTLKPWVKINFPSLSGFSWLFYHSDI